MSRILPLEKDVNLDKRYINETETITENALENVINAGGGGADSPFIVFRSEINLRGLSSSGTLTKAGLAEYLHMTEKDVDDLYAGKYNVVICPDNIPMFLVEYHSLFGSNRVNFSPSNYSGDGFTIYNLGDEWANQYAWD